MTQVTWIDGTANWNTGSDWSTGSAPGANDDAIINSGSVSMTTPNAVGTIALTANGQLSFINLNATATVAGTLTNGGGLHVDNAGSEGGSGLAIGGALINNGPAFIGNGAAIGSTTVSAASLTNTALLSMGSSTTNLASLLIAGTAGFGTTGLLTGSVFMGRNALLQFASGEITSIASGATLSIDGPNAHLTDASDPTTNSALTGLTSIAGRMFLADGAALATAGDLTANELHVDDGTGQGSAALTVAGTFTDSGLVTIGNNIASASTTVGVGALANTGTLNIGGNGAAGVNFGVSNAATNSGILNIGADAILNFDGGFGTYVQAGGTTNVNGTLNAFVDITGGTLDGAGSITGAISNSGGTILGGASASTIGSLNVGSYLQDDTGTFQVDLRGSASSIVNARGSIFLNSGHLDIPASGTLDIHALDAAALAVGHSVTIMTFAPGDLNGIFANITDGTTTSDNGNELIDSHGRIFDVIYDNAGGDIRLKITVPGVGNKSNVSDMNGDGVNDLVFQSHSTVDTLYASMPAGTLVDDIFPALAGVDATQIRAAGSGDVDGNGSADVVFQIGADIVTKAAGDIATTFGPMVFAMPTGWTVSGVGDVNGDGAADILITDGNNDANKGATFYFDVKASLATLNTASPHTVASNLATPGANYVVRGIGDINGDGVNDVVFQNTADGDVIYADMKAVAQHVAANNFSLNDTLHQILSTSVINANLVVKAVGDLDGDGLADLMVEQESDPNAGPVHSLVLEAHNGGNAAFTFQTVAGITDYGAFDVKGIADVTGDGIGDILMQYTQDLQFGANANLHGAVLVADPAHGTTPASITLVTQTVGFGANGADYELV